MRKLLLTLLTLSASTAIAQPVFQQYFDGADTSVSNSVIISYSTPGVWQVGGPDKVIFNMADTPPNALVTDTINPYPVNDTSSFTFKVYGFWGGPSLVALQWKQKLDMDQGTDVGTIEYAINNGPYVSVFNNPTTYNFYGFLAGNKDTTSSGEVGFSGTDSTWRDIWLCFSPSMMSVTDTMTVRFSIKSDSVQNNREGWMIDNIMTHFTIVHTAKENKSDKYLRVFPSPSGGLVTVEAKKLSQSDLIESIEVFDPMGRLLKTFGSSGTKVTLDLSSFKDGSYFLTVKTNVKKETVAIIIKR